MSQFYDQASLVMVPSGYKAGKVYSQKPLTTDGQLTFTRTGDTATRVNADGLVEKVRTNLALYSQDATQTAWTNTSLTVTGDTTTAPDGTLTADTLDDQSVLYGRLSQVFAFQNAAYTWSFFLKKTTGALTHYAGAEIGELGQYLIIDTTNGTGVQALGTSYTYNIVSYDSNWWRVSLTATITAGNKSCQVWPAISSNGTIIANTATGSNVFWGFQLELSDFGPTAYIPTTSAAVSVGPVANLPRIDYTGGGCGKLLLEPQRTNLALYSEQFDNADWSKSDAIATANTTTSPDGYANADSFIDSNNNSRHIYYKTLYGDFSTQRTFSVFAKQNTLRYLALSVTIAGDSHCYSAIFDLQSGTVSATKTNGNGTLTASIESHSNGWYRCIISGTMTTGSGSYFPLIASSDRAGFTGSLFANNMPIYNGSGQSLYLWGAQLEAGSYATSYIPTLSAAVTRGADAAYKSNTFLAGQTKGLLFLDYENGAQILNDFDEVFGYRNNSTFDFYAIHLPYGSNHEFRVRGANGVTINAYANIETLRNKIAMYRDGDTLTIYVNGAQLITATQSGTNGWETSPVSLDFNSSAFPPSNTLKIYQALLFSNVTFTPAQLAELTTL